ncbi:MAG: iron ABC transporter permease [Bacteroidota bacterium]
MLKSQSTNRLSHQHIDFGWSATTVVIVLFLSVPILTILFKLFDGPGESWGHIVKHLLAGYVANSTFLVGVGGGLALLFGVVPAWIVSRYTLPMQRTFEWALILPLAIPNYLTAYAYAGFFDYSGPFQMFTALFTGVAAGGQHVDMMNPLGLAFVLSVSLYPYVYVTARSFFLNQSASQLNAAVLMGARESSIFWRIALPLARPAIAGGLFLVLMEILNDYGAAYYYGVSTFTTAIFRSWFALEEPDTSIYLAALLCLFVLGLILLERFQRRRKGYTFRPSDSRLARVQPTRGRQWLLWAVCMIPLTFGFLIPLFQMLYWSYFSYANVLSSAFWEMIGYSFLLASLSALLCICIAYMLIYGARWSKSANVNLFSRLAVLGYAVPGVVIAVGVLVPGLAIDKWLVTMFKNQFDWSIGFLINGTLIGLLFAYSVRFLAVSFNPIEASVRRLSPSLGEASRLLGASKWRRTKEVNLPLLKNGLWGGALLVFVDVLKELPLTLLLKPYGVITLSTKAYEYASDERIAESALPSLVIIAVGVLPVIFLNKLIQK